MRIVHTDVTLNADERRLGSVEELEETLTEIMRTYPNNIGIIKGWLPSFNDGDPCVFGFDVWWLTVGEEFEQYESDPVIVSWDTVDCIDDEPDYVKRNPLKIIDGKDINFDLAVQTLFGANNFNAFIRYHDGELEAKIYETEPY